MKNIVITGASEGLGREVALAMAEEGVRLFLLARNKEKLQAVFNEIIGKGGEAEVIACDVSDPEVVKAAAGRIETVDVLVNNAGVWHKMSQLDEMNDETVVKVLDTNLTGHILLTKHLLPKLRQSSAPKIVNVISKSGVTAQDGQSVYTASKWGMKGFSDVLRNDLKRAGIRVGAIYQSGTATDMFEKTGEEMPREKFTNPADLAQVVKFMLDQPEKIWLNEVHVTY